MRFSVYQFRLSREAIDRVNTNGWDVALREFPEVAIDRDVKFHDGSENYQSWMFNHYNLVAEMTDISNLEEVFHIGNGYGEQSKMTRVADRMHSLSVGDIIFCHDTNTYLMCDPMGWTAIDIKEAA